MTKIYPSVSFGLASMRGGSGGRAWSAAARLALIAGATLAVPDALGQIGFGQLQSEPHIKTFTKTLTQPTNGISILPDDVDQPELEWIWEGPSAAQMVAAPERRSDSGNWNAGISAPNQTARAWSMAGMLTASGFYSPNFPTGAPLPGGGVSIALAGASVSRHSQLGGPAAASSACYEGTLVLVPPVNAAKGDVIIEAVMVQAIGLHGWSRLEAQAIGGLVGGGRFTIEHVSEGKKIVDHEWLASAFVDLNEWNTTEFSFLENELVPGSDVNDKHVHRLGAAIAGAGDSRTKSWAATQNLTFRPAGIASGPLDPATMVFKTTVLTSAGAYMNPYGSEPTTDKESMLGGLKGGASSDLHLRIASSPGEGAWTIALVSAPVPVKFLATSDATPSVGAPMRLSAYDYSWDIADDLGGFAGPQFDVLFNYLYPRHPTSRCRFYLDRNRNSQIDSADEQIAVGTDGDALNGGNLGRWSAWVTPREDWGSSFRVIAAFENALGERGTPLGRTFQMEGSSGGGTVGNTSGGNSATVASTFGSITNKTVRLASGKDGSLTAVTRSDANTPIVLQRLANATDWTAFDLRSAFSLSGNASDIITWVDPASQHKCVLSILDASTYIMDLTDGTLVDQSTVSANATRITSQPTVVRSASGDVFLAGLNEKRELVIFTHGHGSPSDSWGFANLSKDHLAAQKLSTPSFRGTLIAYANAWGGLNIAGLDQSGQIQVVWWAPGMNLWSVSNLSEISKSPAIAGELSVYTTSWGGVNLAGTDANGKLVVTWWVPQMGPSWAKSNLSELFDGPALRPESVTSYVTPWGGTNIVGTDNNGKVIAYWWAPGLEKWAIAPMTDLIANAELPGNAAMFGDTSPAGEMSMISSNTNGDVFRYYLSPNTANWKSENLSKNARVTPGR